jgi:hypothetical protein
MASAEELKKALERQTRTEEDIKRLLENKKRLLESLSQELDRQRGADISIESTLERQQMQNRELQTDYELLTTGSASKEDIARIKEDLGKAENTRARTAARLREELMTLKDMQDRVEPAADMIKKMNAETRFAMQTHDTQEAEIQSLPKFSTLAFVTAIASVMLVVGLKEVWDTKGSVGVAFSNILNSAPTPGLGLIFFLSFVIIAGVGLMLLWQHAIKKSKKRR